jgi:hypothetical protein
LHSRLAADGTSELSDVTAAVVSKEALSALEQRVEEEEKALAEGRWGGALI